ncbi:hypothetical protein JXM67_13480 [candidate division WOR-3 bacterium]|nr:hypothetical protein [candidate division WOR-3 bacterium]
MFPDQQTQGLTLDSIHNSVKSYIAANIGLWIDGPSPHPTIEGNYIFNINTNNVNTQNNNLYNYLLPFKDIFFHLKGLSPDPRYPGHNSCSFFVSNTDLIHFYSAPSPCIDFELPNDNTKTYEEIYVFPMVRCKPPLTSCQKTLHPGEEFKIRNIRVLQKGSDPVSRKLIPRFHVEIFGTLDPWFAGFPLIKPTLYTEVEVEEELIPTDPEFHPRPTTKKGK